MNTLEGIEKLVESLTGRVEELLDEREKLMAEVEYLRIRLAERDREAVKASQEMQVALESARSDSLRLEQERSGIEAKLQGLNDRLISLVKEQNRG